MKNRGFLPLRVNMVSESPPCSVLEKQAIWVGRGLALASELEPELSARSSHTSPWNGLHGSQLEKDIPTGLVASTVRVVIAIVTDSLCQAHYLMHSIVKKPMRKVLWMEKFRLVSIKLHWK